MTEPAPRAGAEAARLLLAAQQWLRGSAPHLAPVDADGEPCSCPLCRAVAAVRDADPDSVARWVDGAVAAVEQVAAQAAARTAPPADGPEADVDEDVDVDVDVDDEPAPDEQPDGSRRVRRIPIDPQDPAPAGGGAG